MIGADRATHALDLLAGLPGLPQVDLAHSRHVTVLAVDLFDCVAAPLSLQPGGRGLLAAAAYWHDTGHSIGEQGHHKHSFRLIMATQTARLTPIMKLQVACIARYHRKALPRAEHEGFGLLPAWAGEEVRRLAALLRIADGLDNSHRSLVRALHAEVTSRRLDLTVMAPPEAATEVRKATEKADLFRDVFARDLIVKREP